MQINCPPLILHSQSHNSNKENKLLLHETCDLLSIDCISHKSEPRVYRKQPLYPVKVEVRKLLHGWF
ncbi:hypothetical protein K7X08_029048 [Anisodus acutangulus]|uniref:Uncharacterized protein n=1 Tax=Anisodus acutangulus TaxID=402998 RepID=A0A9Q1L3T2_9SOLA|nr:hypothetical protein K7X08_029048 [Anisodus acutangulus]